MSWKDYSKWQAMISGEQCSFCKDLCLEESSFSFKIFDLEKTVVRLPRNQAHYGAVIVVLKRHVIELFDMTTEELQTFWADVALVAKAAKAIFKPVKLNYGVYGNSCPHIHCHIFSRQENEEPLPPTRLRKPVYLKEEEYKEMIKKMKASIKQI